MWDACYPRRKLATVLEMFHDESTEMEGPLAWLRRLMVTVGGAPLTGVKSNTVVAPLLCSMRRNMVGGNPTAVATNACNPAATSQSKAAVLSPTKIMQKQVCLLSGGVSSRSALTAKDATR